MTQTSSLFYVISTVRLIYVLSIPSIPQTFFPYTIYLCPYNSRSSNRVKPSSSQHNRRSSIIDITESAVTWSRRTQLVMGTSAGMSHEQTDTFPPKPQWMKNLPHRTRLLLSNPRVRPRPRAHNRPCVQILRFLKACFLQLCQNRGCPTPAPFPVRARACHFLLVFPRAIFLPASILICRHLRSSRGISKGSWSPSRTSRPT